MTVTSHTEQRRFERRNPISGAVASTALAMTVDQARRVADEVAEAQAEWASRGPGEKRALLLRVAEAVLKRGDDFVASMSAEIGATEMWARFNTRLATSMFTEAAALTTQIGGEVIPSDRPGSLSLAIPRPVGVVLSIAPWNAPIILGARAIATPVACGNGVVFKASEICPRTHQILVEACNEGGLPHGLVGLVSHAPADASAVVEALIEHPQVRRINFTGSTAVGRIIAMRAAAQVKPVLLELGGKSPMLILEDADLHEAVNAAAFGSFMNQGQICMSTERIIVAHSIADEFLRQLREKVRTMTADPAGGPRASLGAVVDEQSVARVMELVTDAIQKGAQMVTGGPPDGLIIPPHVLDQVTDAMLIYRQESFGPVVAILRAKDDDDAVRLANDTEYGLSASVFTRDLARGLRIAQRIQSGMCHINGATVDDEAQMPFGGTKGSGYGRFGGRAGIAEFTELRWISIETEPGHFPI
jgi:benzaldehyde dehydrogenase (NAD)